VLYFEVGMKKLKGLSVACATLISGVASAEVQDMPGGPRVDQLNLHYGVTSIAHETMWLHYMMLIICMVIFIGVFGVMFYSIWAHRKSRHPKPATFHEHMGVEVAWTVIPFIIVIAMALPATRAVVAMKDTSSSDLTVKVTGYQWKWGYEYIDGQAAGVHFYSSPTTPQAQIENREPKGLYYLMEVDNPLVVPVDKKVRVVITAADVIHSWFVPDFGLKQDGIPGFLRDDWFRAEKVGTYRGECAELCGKNHAFMPIVVEVKSAADYAKWADDQKKKMAAQADDPTKQYALEELMTRGQAVFGANCVTCHQANGKGIPGTFPALDADHIVLGAKAEQIKTELLGHPGTAMPPFAGVLNDVELASVITYTRHAWSNAGKGTDPIVQPADVTAGRGK
jgi:cytochrome c oxidase subunit 2